MSDAARRHELPRENGAPTWRASPIMELAIATLAVGEVAGDKLRSAPERIAPAGLIARVLSAGLCGTALATRRRALFGAMLGASTAVVSTYVTFDLRRRAVRRSGQVRTRLVEEGATVALSRLIVGGRGS